jgi:pyruvate formate lyase activating enzyme
MDSLFEADEKIAWSFISIDSLTEQTKGDYRNRRKMISRRDLIIAAAKAGSFAASATILPHADFCLAGVTEDMIRTAPQARYWISAASPDIECGKCHETGIFRNNNKPKQHATIIRCLLCAQNCIILNGERGKCRARINVNGKLRSLVYGRPVAMHVDPIEKKPFYHFLPGSNAFSLATSGCPLRCKFCQNWEISQSRPEDSNPKFIAPQEIIRSTIAQRSPIIAFTYNEPTTFIEYLADIASLANKEKLRRVMISCGFMNAKPLADLCQILDAIKIDLKGYSQDFYRTVCSADLRPVLNSIRQISKSGIHLEIVNLVVPTLNDSEKMFSELIDWILGEIGPDVPIHFTRFHPDYQLLNLPATPIPTLERARNAAMKKGIHYAYVGNVPDHPGNNTYCPQCGKAVIKRSSIFLAELNLEHGRCKFCKKAIPGVWE